MRWDKVGEYVEAILVGVTVGAGLPVAVGVLTYIILSRGC